MILTRKSPFQDYVDRMKELNGCESAQDWCRDVDEKSAQCTFGQAMDEFLQDSSASSAWAAWNIIKLGDKFDVEIRKSFLEKVEDPMMAFQLYIRLASLTDQEDEILKSSFEGKLPVAEKELQDEIVIRRKK